MSLPANLDPATVAAAANLMRGAVAASHLADRPAAEREGIIEVGVAKMMAAGAFMSGGEIRFPRSIGR